MNKCEFCGSSIPYEVTHCPSCGAPCEFIPKPQLQKQSDAVQDDNRPADSKKGYVVSMEDVQIVRKNKKKPSSFDNLESELEQVHQANENNTKNKITCGIVAVLILIILGSCIA